MRVDFDVIHVSVKLDADRNRVWQALTTPAGITSWWAERAEIQPSDGGLLRLVFPNRRTLDSKVVQCKPQEMMSFVYFGGTRALFELSSIEGGTSLSLTDRGFSTQEDYAETLAGWTSCLMALKAYLDFGVDLRNHNPKFNWEHDFVDN